MGELLNINDQPEVLPSPTSPQARYTRRQILRWSAQGAVLAALSPLIAACGIRSESASIPNPVPIVRAQERPTAAPTIDFNQLREVVGLVWEPMADLPWMRADCPAPTDADTSIPWEKVVVVSGINPVEVPEFQGSLSYGTTLGTARLFPPNKVIDTKGDVYFVTQFGVMGPEQSRRGGIIFSNDGKWGNDRRQVDLSLADQFYFRFVDHPRYLRDFSNQIPLAQLPNSNPQTARVTFALKLNSEGKIAQTIFENGSLAEPQILPKSLYGPTPGANFIAAEAFYIPGTVTTVYELMLVRPKQ